MNKLLALLTFTLGLIVLTTVGCKKSSAPPPPEEDLRISTDAASYTIVPGPDYTFTLKVESVMPLAGVKIEYAVTGEVDNQKYPQGPPINSYSKTTNITIVGLPRQKMCLCVVTVTSRSTTTNTAITSFRIGYK